MNRRLSGALSNLLPTVEQTLLLRACLHEAGAGAWTALDQRLGPQGLGAFLSANRKLLALLHRADLRDGQRLGLAADLRRRLAAIALREDLRSAAFHRGAHSTVRTLTESGLDVLVLRGAALAELAYPAPHLRHCHDLDVLVRSADVSRDGDVARDGFEGRATLHRSAFSHPRAQADDGPLWARSRALDLGGHQEMVMAPADLLVHVCGHAYFSESRDSLTWVTDAWFTLASWPDLDWALVAGSAQERNLGVPLALLLGYLRRQLGAPIPPGMVGDLEGQAMEPIDRDIALALAWGTRRAGGPGHAPRRCYRPAPGRRRFCGGDW